jgi:hypothetical protein
MNEAYFRATLNQIEERARRLLGDIPPHADEMEGLAQSSRHELERVIEEAVELRDKPRYQSPQVQTQRLWLIRSLFGQLDLVESFAVAAIQRVRTEDRRMTRLTRELAKECGFPMPAPVVSCTSQDYFNINTRMRLVQIPLTDGRHLLHLPDLIHEIAHLPFAELHNPKAIPLKQALKEFKARIHLHYEEREGELSLGPFPAGLVLRVPVWRDCWLKAWAVELFCDLFATYAIGPAYGWAHIHLCLRQPSVSFLCPSLTETSHPANAARMFAITEGLRAAGFGAEATELAEGWKGLVKVAEEKPEADYSECYPPELLRLAVDFSFQGYKAIGCLVMPRTGMGKGQALLNEAWCRFRTDPASYPSWEQAAMDRYFKDFDL